MKIWPVLLIVAGIGMIIYVGYELYMFYTTLGEMSVNKEFLQQEIPIGACLWKMDRILRSGFVLGALALVGLHGIIKGIKEVKQNV